ncbi:hypothetical protein HG531_013960 [Fusarium graminearum]|nr:hypothetical protein HG531_013960 [Fusarium graminearum]
MSAISLKTHPLFSGVRAKYADAAEKAAISVLGRRVVGHEVVDDGEVEGRIEVYGRGGDSVEAIWGSVASARKCCCSSQVVDVKAHIKVRDVVQGIRDAYIVVVEACAWWQPLIDAVEPFCRTAGAPGRLLVALALPSHAGIAALLS